jgi:hypothetical protein
MNIQPIDLPALLRAVLWPALTIVALAVFRHPLSDLAKTLGQRVHKFSFGGVSLELAEVSEMKTQILETEIRQLDAGLIPQSGASSISGLLMQLQRGSRDDYIMLDLGSEASPRWLTSRLYLLSLLIVLVDRPVSLVYIETAGGIRKRFVGVASPDRTRWALARQYSWLESASAAAYATLGGAYCDKEKPGLHLSPVSSFQFDATTGSLSEWQVSQLMQTFLEKIRAPQPVPPNANANAEEWVLLNNGMSEHAKWLTGERIERLLGSDLSASSVVALPNQNVDDLGDAVLRQPGRLVAVVDTDRSFRCLVDRATVLEGLAKQVLKQAGSKKS